MRIGIDASVIERTRTGISRYLTNLLIEWDKIQDNNQFFLYFKDYIPSDLKLNKVKFVNKLVPAPKYINKGLIWENVVMPLKAKKDKLDLFFSPHYTLPLIKPAKKLVVTIYDISYVAHPEWVPFRNRYIQSFFSFLAAKRSDRIITGLNFGKQEIIKYFKVNPEKIKVIYAAANEIFVEKKDPEKSKLLKSKYNLKNKVILSIGLIMNRRHQDTLIKAFKYLSINRNDISFALIGKNRTFPFMDIDKLISDLDLNESVTYIPYLPEEEIVDMYNLSDLYVYISSYEGEGLPLREAMACGVPTVISPVLKEVTGDCGYVIEEPLNEQLLASTFSKLLDDIPLRKLFISKGLERNKQFSWAKCASETLSLFTELK